MFPEKLPPSETVNIAAADIAVIVPVPDKLEIALIWFCKAKVPSTVKAEPGAKESAAPASKMLPTLTVVAPVYVFDVPERINVPEVPVVVREPSP